MFAKRLSPCTSVNNRLLLCCNAASPPSQKSQLAKGQGTAIVTGAISIIFGVSAGEQGSMSPLGASAVWLQITVGIVVSVWLLQRECSGQKF